MHYYKLKATLRIIERIKLYTRDEKVIDVECWMVNNVWKMNKMLQKIIFLTDKNFFSKFYETVIKNTI